MVMMNMPKDDLNPEQKVNECAKIITYQSAKRNGKLGLQVLETGMFKPEEINRDVNQQVKKIISLFEHKKKVLGHPSIGNITSGDQALVYAAQKVAAMPTTACYVDGEWPLHNWLRNKGGK
jgi:hypothetical protein